MISLRKFLFGPNIYRIHKSSDGANRAYDYQPNGLEETTQKLLNFLWTSKMIIYYTTPLWAIFLYRRGYCTVASLIGFAKLAGWASVLLFGVLIVRGIGRFQNQEYIDFINVLEAVHKQPDNWDKRRKLRAYDFDFRHWPADFGRKESTAKYNSSVLKRLSSQNLNPLSTLVFGLPKEFAAYTVAHTLGIKLVYPGSAALLQAAYGQTLAENRYKLVEEHDGIRGKLLTCDGNEIDSMFVDRRHRNDADRYESGTGPDVQTRNGDILVICCEGNAAFYEVGCMSTPLHCGYSVLGWNHPGFAGSTGEPFPEAENNAMDAVMQYATNKLNFKPENIMMFAWSIGAYTAINAAAAYPDIRGILLDSTFYDIMPFAKKMMPEILDNLVSYTVRNHLNLHNSENLRKYSGPVSFIRRMQDEVMNLAGPRDISSNLGNMLLEELLRNRFPKLFEEPKTQEEERGTGAQSNALWQWFSAPDEDCREAVMNSWSVSSNDCKALLRSYIGFNGGSYPLMIGDKLSAPQKTQLVLYLADKHMRHLSSSHCTPLPPSLFALPWKVESTLDQSDSGSDSSDFEVVQSSSNL